jgi:peptidoglycan hydrolase-like protein with peptidoglycan-binding domain
MRTTRIVAVALLLGSGVAPALAHDTREPHEHLTQTEIERAQRSLEHLGYPVRGVDGRLGARTRTAIRNFQRDENLNATGQLDAGTLMALDEAARTRAGRAAARATEPAGPATIRHVQTRLGDLGYPVGNADGRLGPETRTAIRNYQRDKNLNATGELDAETLSSLDADAGATSGTR